MGSLPDVQDSACFSQRQNELRYADRFALDPCSTSTYPQRRHAEFDLNQRLKAQGTTYSLADNLTLPVKLVRDKRWLGLWAWVPNI